MKIGVDASRAFLRHRTGIEEYSYQVIKNLRDELKSHQVILYIRKNQQIDFELPENWTVKKINCFRLWTQIGLSLEMFFHPVDVLFIPAHTVPIIHPEKTVVVIHGLEYEFCKQAYSLWERIYMRLTIKKSCEWASEIISVSKNTKKDLIELYKVPENKISVIYEGYSSCHSRENGNPELCQTEARTWIPDQVRDDMKSFLLFIGRIEERKNISNIIKAFEILKEKYNIPHKLVLAGKPGFGYENFKFQISNFKFKTEVLELGFISEEEKWELLKNADCFVFPTLYEGFGIPILEAQSVGCPVVASNNSSILEVVSSKSLLPLGEGVPIAIGADEGTLQKSALLVDPQDPENIAEAIQKIIFNEELKKDLIKKGLENVKRFSWEKCSREVADILM